MPLVWRIVLLISLLFIVNSVLATTPAPKKENEKPEEESTDSDEGESADKGKGTVPPEVMKKLKEEIIETEEETAKEFGMTMTLKPEDVETYLEKQEKEYGTELPEVVEKDLAKTKTDDKLQNFAQFLEIFNKIDIAATEDEEVTVRKTPEEMKKLKEENYKLLNELNEKVGMPEVPPKVFDEIWEEKKKEFGKHFPARAEKAAATLKKTIKEMDAKATEAASEGPETEIVTATQFGVSA